MKFNIGDTVTYNRKLRVKILNTMSISNDTLKMEVYTCECINNYNQHRKGDIVYFNGDNLKSYEHKSYLPTWL
jgi:ASC-1-like (ASCH) protein